ncbi:hypothetical protein [Catalinimonas niigatensis]|uniref:hypothetical protein n=1 Tax=Catalinimonas niigatensis TaxID=1397264 RepID=UPI00266595C4|nr:hypothetical protein [Catalinimonas niigatensis]WPP51763.1 hypothetical protein PZB72_05105 [Catalinimonas niigatensis]
MGDKMSHAEDPHHQHSCNTTGSHTDHLNRLSIDQLEAQNQHLWQAYQNLKQERDMLRKALNIYHRTIILPFFVKDYEATLGDR